MVFQGRYEARPSCLDKLSTIYFENYRFHYKDTDKKTRLVIGLNVGSNPSALTTRFLNSDR